MTTIDGNDPVILQWYCKAKKRHVFVVPRKAANEVKYEHPNGRIHIWEVQKGLEGFARLVAKSALIK